MTATLAEAVARVTAAVERREAWVQRDLKHRRRSGDKISEDDVRETATVGSLNLVDLQLILAALSEADEYVKIPRMKLGKQ